MKKKEQIETRREEQVENNKIPKCLECGKDILKTDWITEKTHLKNKHSCFFWFNYFYSFIVFNIQ